MGCERGEREVIRAEKDGGLGGIVFCFLHDTQIPPVTPVAWRKPWPEGLDIFSEALEGANMIIY